MTTTETQVASKLSITAGMGTAAIAIGLVVIFFGYTNLTLWAIGLGSFIIGAGAFVALCCATVHLFSDR